MSVISSIERLSKHLKHVSDVIRDNLLYCQLCGESGPNQERKAIDAITSITHEENFDGRRLIEQPGLIVLNERCCDDIVKINQLKSDFINACKSFKLDVIQKDSGSPSQELRYLLNEAGFLRAHLKQIERMPVIITEPPRNIHWYIEAGGWGKQRKLLKQDILAMLDSKKNQYINSGFYEIAHEKIGKLSNKEVFCVRHKSANTIKTSIFFEEKVSNHVGTLPIILMTSKSEIEAIKKIDISLHKSQTGTKKNRSKFESDPILDFFNIYRYKEMYRSEIWNNYVMDMKKKNNK